MAVTTPERLPAMYWRIIALICQGQRPDRTMARWIILWLTFAKRPLAMPELEESVRFLDSKNQTRFSQGQFEKAVVMTCAGLVEKTMLYVGYQNRVTAFRFIHTTVREFFSDLFSHNRELDMPREAFKYVEMIATPTPHLDISRSCLQYLLYCMPPRSLSESLGQQPGIKVAPSDLSTKFPLSGYVTAFWTSHLQETIQETFGRNERDYTARNLLASAVCFSAFYNKIRSSVVGLKRHTCSRWTLMRLQELWRLGPTN